MSAASDRALDVRDFMHLLRRVDTARTERAGDAVRALHVHSVPAPSSTWRDRVGDLERVADALAELEAVQVEYELVVSALPHAQLAEVSGEVAAQGALRFTFAAIERDVRSVR